jgi:hypothetical protein
MGLGENKMLRLLFGVLVAAIGLGWAANVRAAECPVSNRLQIGGMVVQPCFERTLNDPIVGNLTNYYGQVMLTTGAGGSYEIDKSVGRYLRSVFGIREDFTSVVALEVRKGDVLVYQKPLYTVNVTRGDASRVTVTANLGADAAISPIFLLDQGGDAITASLRVSSVSKRGSAVLNTVKEGVDTAAALGGHGWLVTGFGSEAFLTTAAKFETALNQFYSDDLESNINTTLSYGAPTSYKAVTYEVTLPPAKKKAPPAKISATVHLRTIGSLVTDDRITVAGQQLPDTKGGVFPSTRWAERISIGGNGSIKLGSQLDAGGVPRKLADLQVPPGARPEDTTSRKALIEAACESLRAAVEGGPFRLNDHDRQLVMFDELRRAGVFRIYSPTEIGCVSNLLPEWGRYAIKLPQPPPPPLYTSKPGDRVSRLEVLAVQWDIADLATRKANLPLSFNSPVALTARPDMISNYPAPVAPAPSGLATWQVQPALLAELRKSCFGNFKPPSDGSKSATAFARFEGDSRGYLLEFTFDETRPFGQGGPTINGLSIREATPEDRATHDHNGKCT